MPFNGSGVFQRIYRWVDDRDDGITILADRVDGETDGIVAGINDVVSGTQPFTGTVKAPNGTAASPTFAFTGDTDTGVYRAGADTLGFSVNGTLEAQVEAGFLDAVNGLKIAGTAVTSTAAELNILDGVTASAAEINILDGVTATAAELNILDGVTATTAELNLLDGVTNTIVTTSGFQTLTNKTLGDPILNGTPSEDVYDWVSTSGNLTIDPANGSIQTVTMTGNIGASDGFSSGQAITLMIDGGSGYTFSWPTMTWVNNGGVAPTLAPSGYTVITLWKINTDLYGLLAGDGS